MVNKSPGCASLYLQIAQELETLLSGLRYGEQIPSESELVAQYGVSRGTIRQALDFLVNRGDLYRLHGKGTFRGSGIRHTACNRIPSYTDSLLLAGKVPSVSHVTLQAAAADALSAHYLSVPTGEPIWLLSRFRGAQGEAPSCFAEAHIPQAVLPELRTEDLEQSVLQMLTVKFGLQISSTANSIFAQTADDAAASRFRIAPQSPLLVADFVVCGPDGRPILYDRSTHWDPAFRYRIESTYPL